MSETQFTPGPWGIESQDWGDGRNPTGIVDRHDIGVIRSDEGFAFWHQDQPDSAVAWANARLIAASPDLFAICEEYQEELGAALAMSYMAEMPTEVFDDLNARLKRVSAALKKARGEA